MRAVVERQRDPAGVRAASAAASSAAAAHGADGGEQVTDHVADDRAKACATHRSTDARRGAAAEPQLDEWLADPALRRRGTGARAPPSADRLWRAAREVSLSDTALLGRLVRWRIPGLAPDTTYDGLFREPPFMVLEEGERMLVSGLVGRIWTLRRDYPRLRTPDEFRELVAARHRPGACSRTGRSRSTSGARRSRPRCAWSRSAPRGRIGLAAVRPLVRSFQQLVGSDGISAAVRRAERGERGDR